MAADGGYHPTHNPANKRGLQKDLKLNCGDQILAVYPASQAPHPWPYPFPMDREEGIETYKAMITADEYKARRARGETDDWDDKSASDGQSPVLRLENTGAEVMVDGVTKYEFARPNGGDLPEWTTGVHLDIVVAPEYLRQYSMPGDPADQSTYQIGVLGEDRRCGGSALLHRIFNEGGKVFISRLINHFPLEPTASRSFLIGGGTGMNSMIAMAHELHPKGAEFEVHYSTLPRAGAGYLADLAAMPWPDQMSFHISDKGGRADLDAVRAAPESGWHVYTCGPDRYMAGVIEAAARQGVAEEARHLEYPSVPEVPDYENHNFTLQLKDGRDILVPADQGATDVLVQNGIHVDVKCADWICDMCKCGLIAGEVEHRGFVLSKAQRQTNVILFQLCATQPEGGIKVDL